MSFQEGQQAVRWLPGNGPSPTSPEGLRRELLAAAGVGRLLRLVMDRDVEGHHIAKVDKPLPPYDCLSIDVLVQIAYRKSGCQLLYDAGQGTKVEAPLEGPLCDCLLCFLEAGLSLTQLINLCFAGF